MNKQRLEISRGALYHNVKIIPETHILLGDYAKTTNTTIQDALHRLLLDFFTEFHHFEDPNKLVKGTHKVIFPNSRAIHDVIVSIAHGKKPRRRPIPLRKDGKLPSFLTESDSSGQDNS